MICMEYIIDGNKILFTIRFNYIVLKYLKAKVNDYLYFFQSQYKSNFFTLLKTDTGYRIKRFTEVKKVYQINSRYMLSNMNGFTLTECNYFLKKNGIIKIILP